MTVAELFGGIKSAQITGDPRKEIRGINIDSRLVESGDLFVALKGSQSDGNQFVSMALGKGAAAIAGEGPFGVLNVPTIQFSQPRKHLGELSSRVYGEPSRKQTVIGITGTNGKTTTAHLVEHILHMNGKKVGNIGTVSYHWGKEEQGSSRTTPEATELQRYLRKMLDAGVSHVVLECSSHGLEMERLNSLSLDVAVFTNLTPDHLDFHASLEDYKNAKWKLFNSVLKESAKPKRTAVLNLDDPVGREWKKKIQLPMIMYSADGNPDADLRSQNATFSAEGIKTEIDFRGTKAQVQSRLIGHHNLENILAATSVGLALEIPMDQISRSVDSFACVRGRLERVENRRGIHVFVDYAHTEDALKNVISALKPFRKKRLIVVFGCGGDRDKGKRPRMGEVVFRSSDIAIVTSDNPRSEQPERIIDDILSGFSDRSGVTAIVDRKQAIAKALRTAEPGDLVLIAGKGHETYQEIQGQRFPFDDSAVAKEWFEGNS